VRRFEVPPPRRVYRVSELLAEVSEALSTAWRQISVAGEACEVRAYPSGHVYFSLKDETGKLSAVIWRSDAARMKFRLEDGMEIVAFGTLSLYAARGQFQIQVQAIEPVGAGALQLAFEQLKRKLAAEGLFDAARKKPLPFLPRRIGIVTSPQGAALRDILNVLARRHPNLAITIFPARVQGEGAAAEISEGIEALNRRPDLDVIIVARGGGSAEDLAAFNDERVARTLAASRLPTISAVGHETDWTIADYVADLRAPTPSAAAEMVVGVKEEISRRVEHSRRSLLEIARRRLAELRHRLFVSRRAEPLVEFPHLLLRRRDRFDAARESLRAAIARRPEAYRNRLSLSVERLAGIRRLLSLEARRRFFAAAGRLRALDPLSILQRGYAVVEVEGRGGPLTDAANVSPGDELHIRLWRGRIRARTVGVDADASPGEDSERKEAG
jgi:exodeoxyribonuclease VII large subunit